MKNLVAATPEVIHQEMAHWADNCAACLANMAGDTMYDKGMYLRMSTTPSRTVSALSILELRRDAMALV
jgi:hypothetical protein